MALERIIGKFVPYVQQNDQTAGDTCRIIIFKEWTDGRGGWIINHTFVIGGGGYGLANNIRSSDAQSFIFPHGETYLNFG